MPAAFDAKKFCKQNLNEETVVKLKEVFDVFDYDGSGNISSDELINTIRALGLEDQATQIINIVHNSGFEGEMDFGAFLDIFGFGSDLANEGTVQGVFDIFDEGKNGAFGPEEFEKVAASVGENFSAAEVDQMIAFADKDKDGVINYDDFINVVGKVYPKV